MLINRINNIGRKLPRFIGLVFTNLKLFYGIIIISRCFNLIQNNNVLQKPHVVYGLLDWGLGHTTRSIPIIRHLMKLNCNILVACNSNQKAVLLKEFPEIEYKELEGYELRYATKGWLTILYIILQIPKILIKINRENRWLKGLLLEHKADLVVSDNRYGFYSSKMPSIFITHQLSIRTGLGSVADKLIRFFNYRSIKHFTTCWVPDYAGKENLAGSLSHPDELPSVPVQWLGALSRFEPCIQQIHDKDGYTHCTFRTRATKNIDGKKDIDGCDFNKTSICIS